MILISLSFVLSDWMISLFTFSDFLMLLVMGLIFLQKININKKDSYSYIVIEGYVILNILVQLIFNEAFVLKYALTNLVKIAFYHTFVLFVYKYIISRELKKTLLKVLNIAAIISIIIGLYITLVIKFDLPLPYEFIWSFTRSDKFSYTFRRLTSIIRTRSIFSEPAHLGYFLNMILSFNLFSKYAKFVPNFINVIIIGGVIATLSYSSIAILTLILFVFLIKLIKKKKYKWVSSRTFVMIGIVLIVMFIFKDFLYGAIYIRTLDILSGNDGSFINRIITSWTYIDMNNLVIGNGLSQTPAIQNIYAYFLSDLGIAAFLFSVYFTFILIRFNLGIGLSFLLLNFSKGGYLSPIFSLYVLLILLYTDKSFVRNIHKKQTN